LPLTRDLQGAWSDVAEMFELRRRLAELEIKSDIAASRRLAVFGGIGAVLALAGLPIVLMTLAAYADAHWTNVSFPWISLASGAALLVAGALLMLAAWRRFRYEFLGLRETLAELREDVVWLREWVGDANGGDSDEGVDG
jgi:uncharacterized membrane protein YqjE